MEELAASLSHEIKQPIAAAVGNAVACLLWLDRDEPDLLQVRETAVDIIKEARRAADIDTPRRKTVSLNELIQEVILMLQDKAHLHSVMIRTELDATLAMVPADRVHLQQVLLNLMLNGVEAMTGAKRADYSFQQHRGSSNSGLGC